MLPMLRVLRAFGLVAVVVLFPLIVRSDYFIHVGTTIGINIVLAISLDIAFGYTGLISFAQNGFYGLGAYVTAILMTRTHAMFWLTLIPALLVPGLVAAVVALPTVRLRGHYLAMATLALGLGIRTFFIQAGGLTGGALGIQGIDRPQFLGAALVSETQYYYLVLTVAVCVAFGVDWLVRTRIGHALLAIREDEAAAASVGIDTRRFKLFAFTFSAMLAGFAGALYAPFNAFISPDNFTLDVAVAILAMVVIGGLGSVAGAIVGAFVISVIPEFLYSIGDFQFLVYGLLVILIVMFMPQGIVGTVRRAIRQWRRPALPLANELPREEAGHARGA